MPSDIQAFASPEVQAFANGFPMALLQAVVSLAILLGAVTVHSLLTPFKELGRARQGEPAAAVSLGGIVLGLAIPLARSLQASASVIETAIWGVAAAAVILLVFRLADVLLKGLPERVQQGDIAAAILLTATKVGSGLVIAAAFSG